MSAAVAENERALSATAGLAASASDVARFSMALDKGRLLSDAMRARAWTPPSASDGRPLPYALGWFVQENRGYHIVWITVWNRPH